MRSFLKSMRNQTKIKAILVMQGVISPQRLINILNGVLESIMDQILNPSGWKGIFLMAT